MFRVIAHEAVPADRLNLDTRTQLGTWSHTEFRRLTEQTPISIYTYLSLAVYNYGNQCFDLNSIVIGNKQKQLFFHRIIFNHDICVS